MAYNFSIDKKSGIIFLTGCTLVGLLLFVAGFLVGIEVQISSRFAEGLAKSAPSPSATLTKLELPGAKPAEQSATAQTAATPAPPEQTPLITPGPASPPEQSVVPLVTPAPPEPKPATSLPAAPTAAGPLTTGSSSDEIPAQLRSLPPTERPQPVVPTTVPSTVPSTQARVASGPAETTASPQSAPPEEERTGEYSIQIGAFLDPSNAARLVKELQEKGYKATIFNAVDAKHRVWHAVRIGPFQDLQTASREAATFRHTEQLFALVRPARSL